jgi:2-polyprenyl-6-methoxyphenol hydroxylase-like FAD-dependent oxidoreductase
VSLREREGDNEMQKLKTLIIGAGVAGLTCAGLLANQGIYPLVIEREDEKKFNKSGYMLGILPLGGRVLNALNARDGYFENSIQMENYEIHQGDGDLIKRYPLDFINKRYGSYRGITRTSLIDILLHQAGQAQIRFGTTVAELNQDANGAEVTFSNGNTERFELVIVADGLHSDTRKLVLNQDECEYYDTGWGGWVTWLHEDPTSSYVEYWGSGSFLGLYPVKDKIGIFFGGPVNNIKEKGLKNFRAEMQQRISPAHELPHRVLNAFGPNNEPFFWEFHDCRSNVWYKNNVVLLGDVATGFLPTAGVGASMAMDSAAALADELSRVDKEHIGYGLKLYSFRQKERVEKAQKDSRQLGKMMFINSSIISAVRDEILPFYSLQRMLSDLSKIMEGGE